jgi:hypothetical protein
VIKAALGLQPGQWARTCRAPTTRGKVLTWDLAYSINVVLDATPWNGLLIFRGLRT